MELNVATEWHIRVKALLEGGEEKEFQIPTLANETVGQFRHKLATESLIEPQKQRLIFCGRLLSDNSQKVADTGMRDGSALHMVARAIPAATTPDTEDAGAERSPRSNARNTGRMPTGFGLPRVQPFFPLFSGNMNMPQMGGSPSTQRQGADGERVIREVHRNFGANDGGEWIAVNQNNRYFRIGREAEPGSHLTPEEFQRGPIETSNPISRSSESSSYEPLPGLVRMEPAHSTSENSQPESLQPESYRDVRISRLLDQARTAPSQALINELTHDLFDYVMPEIRRLPGNNDFRFSTTDSLRPTYLEQSSNNSVGAAGASLANLGDAYIALGNALQSIGSQWQAGAGDSEQQGQRDASAPEQQSRSALRILTELSLTSPLAVPLLQSNPVNPDSQSQQQPTADNARDENNISNGQSIVNENQVRILTSRARRNHRYHAFEQMIDASSHPVGRGGAATLEVHIGPIGSSAVSHPQIMQAMRMMRQNGPNDQQQPQAQQGQSQAQQPQTQGAHNIADILQRVYQHNASSGRNVTSGGGNAEGSANDTANAARISRSVRFMPTPNAGGLVMERIISSGADSHTIPAPSAQPRNQTSASQQEQQQEPSPPHANSQSSQTTNESPVYSAGAAEQSVTLGSQSGRSDRSVGSTTTEYSNSNNPFVHGPRIFGPLSGSIHSQHQHPQPVESILQQQLARATNPFSTAMVFLGAEPGSTTSNTSRRASVSSSTNDAQNIGDTRGDASEGADATTNPSIAAGCSTTDAANAEPSSSATAAAPRTGETRGRTSSSSESDVNVGGRNCGGASGSSKRHRACDGAEDN
ncbi:hypothetical protein H4R24_000186 [Coemansia sp. RSA 988]|nr:hypothetical protein H4R24_000186 [Coemansia sp. RSA 988]